MVCSCDHHQRVIEQPFLFNTFSRAGIGQCSNEKIEIPLAKLFSQSCLLPVDNINLNLRMGGVKASDGVRKQLGPCERHGTDDDPAYGRALQSRDFVQAVLQLVPGQSSEERRGGKAVVGTCRYGW